MTAKASSVFNSFIFQQGNAKQRVDAMDQNDAFSDLHLKMSKKIAQLTKVIYSLNSKNDEYENMIAQLKLQYDTEKEQLIAETNKKLDEYKHRLLSNNDQSKQIAKLDGMLKDFQLQKEQAQRDFDTYKSKAIENEESLRENYANNLNALNKQMEDMKSQFELQLQEFKTVQQKYDAEKTYLVEDLKSRHRLEIENLKQSLNSNKDSFQTERKKLEEIHKQELAKLQAQIDELKLKSQQDSNEYEQNITKLRTFHEKELDALKANSDNKYLTHINELKVEMEKLRKEKHDVEIELRQQYKEHLQEIVKKDEEIEELRNKLLSIQTNLDNSGKDLTVINDELMKAKVESQKLMRKLTEVENENNSVKERYDKQSKELLDKSNHMSKLEAENLQMASTISDLKHELSSVRERLNLLEEERKLLENTNSSQSEKNLHQIRSLEKALADITSEKQALIVAHTKTLEALKQSHAEAISKLNLELKVTNERITNEYELKLNNERALHEEKILTLERNLNREFNSESHKLSKDKERLQNELNKMNEELKSRTSKYDSEISNLQASLLKYTKELNEATSKVNILITDKGALEIELNDIKKAIDIERKKASTLSEDYEKLQLLYDASSKDAEIDTKVKLEKLSKELNTKWSDILKDETEKLRRELIQQKDEEHRHALDDLANLKDQELKNLKDAWQSKTNELLNEISVLRQDLNDKELQANNEIERLKKELSSGNKELRQELVRLQEEYNAKIELLESQRDDDIQSLIRNLTIENEKKLSDLKTKYMEDLQSQMSAQKTAMSNMKNTLEKNKKLELEVMSENHAKEMEFIKNDLMQTHYLEIDDLRRAHEKELLNIKHELERAIDINKLKERETQMKLEEMQSEIHLRNNHIDDLSKEMQELKHYIDDLKDEINIKSTEVHEIKIEAQREIKNRESTFLREKEDEFNSLNAEHIKQKQLLVNEFKQAQELFKRRISELEEALDEMEVRYKNRESREEDMELIQNLQNQLKEKQDYVKKVQDEKKYYQMELVNRETNFNKMFNTTTNIGVMNPLSYPTKPKSKSTSANGNGGTVSPSFIKLDPIPGGSPLHDLTLNPNKPLPKKFLK